MRTISECIRRTLGDGGILIDRDGEHGAAVQVERIRIIASNGGGWDHVSVSRADRIPTYDEMERVRDWFFLPEETVVQLSVPRARHINLHPHCLHLWRKQDAEHPLPPEIFV